MTKRPSSSPGCAVLAAALVVASAAPARADPPYAPAPMGTPAAAGAAPTAPAWTRVHIVTQRPKVALERRAGSLPTDKPALPQSVYSSAPVWDPVCAAPCDIAVQLGGEYRIAGEDVTASSGFSLHGPTTDLLVDAGAYGVRRAGVWLVVVGFLAAAAGGIFLGVNAIPKAGQPTNVLDTSGIAALSVLAGGATVGVVGIGLVVGGGTSVRDETRRDLARLAPPSALHATFLF